MRSLCASQMSAMVTDFASRVDFASTCSTSGEVSLRISLLIERMTCYTTPFRASLNEPTPHCLGALQRIIAQLATGDNIFNSPETKRATSRSPSSLLLPRTEDLHPP